MEKKHPKKNGRETVPSLKIITAGTCPKMEVCFRSFSLNKMGDVQVPAVNLPGCKPEPEIELFQDFGAIQIAPQLCSREI